MDKPENIEECLKGFIEKEFLCKRKNYDLNLDEKLFDSGIIDSFGFPELLSFIKKTYGVSFERSEIFIEDFNTVIKIAQSIRKKTILKNN